MNKVIKLPCSLLFEKWKTKCKIYFVGKFMLVTLKRQPGRKTVLIEVCIIFNLIVTSYFEVLNTDIVY